MQSYYLATARGQAKGGIVLLHEAFGLTPHIRRQADAFAGLGYTTLAPDMLTPIAPIDQRREAVWQSDGIHAWLPQNKAGLDEGRRLIPQVQPAQLAALLADALEKLAPLPVATVGYCWGGSVSFMAAKMLPVACAVAYYGGRLAELAAAAPKPKAPVLIHLAKLDRYIPYDEARASIETNTPEVEVYGYDADHGFNRDDGPTYDPAVANQALARTLAFLDKHLT